MIDEFGELYKCNIFTHEAPKSSRNSFKGVRAFQVELEFRNVGFVEGGKLENPEKNPPEQGREPTTRATLVGGKRSHHCAFPEFNDISQVLQSEGSCEFDTDILQPLALIISLRSMSKEICPRIWLFRDSLARRYSI